jgi:hypothetical protein
MIINTRSWLSFSFVNLLIVGVLGALMRYKIGFEFPHFNQLYLQHAHSHFAFAGWVTHTLYVLMISFVSTKGVLSYERQLSWCVMANLVCAYGMLVSFPLQGYGAFSVSFSAGTILAAGFFTFYFWKELNKTVAGHPGNSWFKAGLLLSLMSSLGTFYLAYMMISGNIQSNLYLASVYYYLHFQYNGFFIFSCFGLILNGISSLLPGYRHSPVIFRMFALAVVPAYFLSILWAKIPLWLYLLVIAAAFLQFFAWVSFLTKIRKAWPPDREISWIAGFMLLFAAIAFSIKLVLQLGSTIPQLSQLAFGFRPIVIAYLHLVLLAVITVFLLAYMYWTNLSDNNKLSRIGLFVVSAGIFLNELVLAVQGVASFGYVPVPGSNASLFYIALIILIGLIILILSRIKSLFVQPV